MKQFKALFFVCMLLSVLVLNSTTTYANDSISIVDAMDNEVVLTKPAERIVALQPSDVEILFAIGAGETVVGKGSYVDYPEEDVKSIKDVGSAETLNIETIIELKPDLVIADALSLSEDAYNQLKSNNIQIMINEAEDIDQVYETIEEIGILTGKVDESKAVITTMKSDFEKLSDIATENNVKGSVYFEVSPLEYGLWTAGNDTFMSEIADLLGLTNVFSDVEGWAEISQEQIIEKNPDIIVTITAPSDSNDNPVEEISKRSGWQTINAIKNNTIYLADSNMISRPGPRLVEATKSLLEFLIGEEVSLSNN